jgi:hypothetical protein
LRASVPGPALELSGCATGQKAVASFVTALKDIDGVTRVGVEVSELPVQRAGAGSTEGKDSEKSGGDDECESRSYLASFSIVVAFDAAPVPETDAAAEVASATEQAETTSTEAEGG